MSTRYHEEDLSTAARDAHRALASIQEELEAVDWYNQRLDVTDDEELGRVLKHNRDEEIEHAAMILEWLRRRIPEFDEHLKTYLFTEKSITQIEEEEEEQEASPAASTDLGIGKLT